MLSFLQRLSSKPKNEDNNSIQQEIILDSMKDMQESIADRVSQATSSAEHIEELLHNGSSMNPKPKAANDEAEEGLSLEHDIEDHSEDALLKSIKRASSADEISSIIQHYQQCLQSWNNKAVLLQRRKHLKEYLSVNAALTMLEKLTQNPERFKAGQLHESIRNGLNTQRQSIETQSRLMQAQNQKLHATQQQLKSQHVAMEQSVQQNIVALKANQARNQSQNQVIQQLQNVLTQSQAMREASVISTKTAMLSQLNQTMQAAVTLQQSQLRNNSVKDAAQLNMIQAQQQLQQSLKQSNLMQQQLQSHNQAHIIEQINQRSAVTADKILSATIASDVISQGSKESAKLQNVNQKSTVVQVTNEPSVDIKVEAAKEAEATKAVTKERAVPNEKVAEVEQTKEKGKSAGHDPSICTGICCKPDAGSLSLDAITKMSAKALADVKKNEKANEHNKPHGGHEDGCPCGACVTDTSIEPAFNQQKSHSRI